MAGYGNKTNMQPEVDDSDIRYGINTNNDPYQGGNADHKSGTVGGVGFGNKTNPAQNLDTYDSSDLRLGSHQNTDPYSGGHSDYKSGTVGGAGFGNKTSGHATDSTAGKIMEKVGGIMHNEKMVEKGHEKRAAKGAFDGEAETSL